MIYGSAVSGSHRFKFPMKGGRRGAQSQWVDNFGGRTWGADPGADPGERIPGADPRGDTDRMLGGAKHVRACCFYCRVRDDTLKKTSIKNSEKRRRYKILEKLNVDTKKISDRLFRNKTSIKNLIGFLEIRRR